MKRDIEIHRIVWNGIVIEIGYRREFLSDLAHLAIKSLAPESAPLPITETGYRSHFLDPQAIEEAGGPAALVREWLDLESERPAWRAAEQRRRQFELF